MKFLLDTCAVIWLISDPMRISSQTIKDLTSPYTRVYLSAITAAELACAQDRNRIQLDRHWKIWLRDFVTSNGWEVLPIDWQIMEEAWSLPGEFHNDPADRVIVATARSLNLRVVTGDSKILSYPHVTSVC